MNDIDEFLSKNDNADGVIILSLETTNDQPKRQLGFYIKNFDYLQSINDYLQSNELNLDLHERSIPINHVQIKLFDQKTIQSSRKQILPFIEKFTKDFLN